MKRTVLLCSFAISVFCVGIAGGNHLRSFLHRPPLVVQLESTPNPENVLADVPEENIRQPVNESAEAAIIRQGFVDRTEPEPDTAEHAVFISRVREITASVPEELNTESDENFSGQVLDEGASERKFNPAKRATIVRMILQYLPDLTTNEVNVWAEQLMDLSIDEAHFLLRQKQASQRSSTFQSLPASLTDSLDQILSHVEGTTADAGVKVAQSDSLQGSNSTASAVQLRRAVEIVKSNLLASNTPGFRGQRVILDAAVYVTEKNPALPTSFRLTTQTRFDCAAAAFSGNPLHVSLPGDPQLMFQISLQRNADVQDGENTILLTRRGKFSILESGQLGLQIGDGQFALAPEIAIPSEATRVWVTSNSEVRCLTEDSSEVLCGQLPIVRVQRLSELSTTDGVTFAANQNNETVLADTANLVLQTESFELSNVDHRDEWLLLEHFRRLLHETQVPELPVTEHFQVNSDPDATNSADSLFGVSRVAPVISGE